MSGIVETLIRFKTDLSRVVGSTKDIELTVDRKIYEMLMAENIRFNPSAYPGHLMVTCAGGDIIIKKKELTCDPCPFCGGKAECSQTCYSISHWMTRCAMCAAAGPEKSSPDAAIEAWNSRKEK